MSFQNYKKKDTEATFFQEKLMEILFLKEFKI